MSTDRREFLGTLLAAGLAPELVARTGGQEGGAFPEPVTPPAALQPAADPPWDMSWTTRLTGPHRAVFDWPQPRASGGLWRAGLWKDEVKDTFGAKPEEIHAVLVIRHAAIPMILQDEFWERHKIGKARKIKDPFTGKTASRNPYRVFPGQDANSGIEGFLKGGGTVLACGLAFGFMVSLEAKLQKKKAPEVRPELLGQVIPGIVLQPSGFFALLEAQRNGCGLFPADME